MKAAQELARHSKPELTANTYTHLTIKDTAADVERLPAIPTGRRSETNQATGTDGRVLSKCLAKSEVLKGVNSSDQPETLKIRSEDQETKKRPENKAFPSVSVSDADGTRTRNHRIDSPVL